MDYQRRDLILGLGSAIAVASPIGAEAAQQRIQVRVWPGDESTRISIESPRRLKYTYMMLRNKRPYRLVLDIEGIQLSSQLSKTMPMIEDQDRYLKAIRTGQFKRNILRLVFELKNDVKASVNYSKPVASFGHRIIVEVEPTNADLMSRVIEETSNGVRYEQPRENLAQHNAVSETQREVKTDSRRRNSKTETLVVVVDPGHGGEDPGAIGKRRRTYEKNVVLAISRKLADKINRTRGMRAVMTRNRDVFLPLAKRAGIAIKERAHIFVSIHADAWINANARGSSVFTLSTRGASSLQARWLAQSQNRSDEIGGTIVRNVAKQAQSTVVDMLAEVKLRYGIQLGDEVLKEMAKLGPLHKSKVEYAQFAVLKAQGVPSILVETAFLSNPKDENRLRDARQQARMAEAIFEGIRNAVRADPSLLRQG